MELRSKSTLPTLVRALRAKVAVVSWGGLRGGEREDAVSSSSRYRNPDVAIGGGGPAKSIWDFFLDSDPAELAPSLYLAEGEEPWRPAGLLLRLCDAAEKRSASCGRGESSDRPYSLGWRRGGGLDGLWNGNTDASPRDRERRGRKLDFDDIPDVLAGSRNRVL